MGRPGWYTGWRQFHSHHRHTIGVRSPPATTAALVMSYPDHIAAITMGNTFYLVAVILWVPLFLALYRTLRGRAPPPLSLGPD